MGMKNYPPEFKAEAVALYESRPEATIRSVAADPGINPESLRPNTKYIGDITHLPILGRKFCCTATVIDLAKGRPAGWAIAGHRRAALVSDAMAAAIRPRGSLAGSIRHTGHGAQYTSSDFAEAFDWPLTVLRRRRGVSGRTTP